MKGRREIRRERNVTTGLFDPVKPEGGGPAGWAHPEEYGRGIK